MAKRKRNLCELLVHYDCTYAWVAGDCVHRRPYKDGNAGGQAYYRATWDEVVPTGGRAVIVSGVEEDA